MSLQTSGGKRECVALLIIEASQDRNQRERWQFANCDDSKSGAVTSAVEEAYYTSGLRLDPVLPKDLGLFYESDCLGGCFALVQYDPEIVSSWEGSEFLAPELSKPAASQQDVRYRLPSFPAWAVGVGDARYSSVEEEVLEPNLFRAHLDQECALAFTEAFVEAEDLLCRLW
ncbi:hypothetical protein CABS01_17181, partial [Colletotrichum abscissum]|uniref:uncharacterized protein n=1 Tax=Colletotrichum abscissum TaxID=1671311 RepID=UPI0027D5CFB5